VRAFKFLGRGARGRFSGHVWPTPAAGLPGAWVTAPLPLVPCTRGVHACRDRDLAYWLDDELWAIELDGELVETATMVVAERGRLCAALTRWNDELRAAFGQFCLDRAQAVAVRATDARRPDARWATRLARDLCALLDEGELNTAAYVGAVAAQYGGSSGPLEAFAAERAVQSRWLVERLSEPG
jgi:hypothetical protein